LTAVWVHSSARSAKEKGAAAEQQDKQQQERRAGPQTDPDEPDPGNQRSDRPRCEQQGDCAVDDGQQRHFIMAPQSERRGTVYKRIEWPQWLGPIWC
jgi:hypothetical protein